jgi:hypothetical protein
MFEIQYKIKIYTLLLKNIQIIEYYYSIDFNSEVLL